MQHGVLRQDLYYRLQASVLRVPPLRERAEDIGALAEHFIDFFNEKFPRKVPATGIEEDALAAMRSYPWPGNVRELSNAIEGAFTFGDSATLRLGDLPSGITGSIPIKTVAAQKSQLTSYIDAERDLIERALQMAEWNKAKGGAHPRDIAQEALRSHSQVRPRVESTSAIQWCDNRLFYGLLTAAKLSASQ